MSDATAMRFWSTLPHESLNQTEEFLGSMIASAGEGGDDFIVEANGAVIGKLGCHRLPEMGYLLSPNVWGLGYATEALAAYIAHRRHSGGGELTADTDPRNYPSIKLLRRHGFVESGRAEQTWLIGGQWFDSIYWRLQL